MFSVSEAVSPMASTSISVFWEKIRFIARPPSAEPRTRSRAGPVSGFIISASARFVKGSSKEAADRLVRRLF